MNGPKRIELRYILARVLLIVILAGIIVGVVFIAKCIGDSKYIYPSNRKRVGSLEELKLGLADVLPEILFPGLDVLNLEPASVKYNMSMTNPHRTADPTGYYITGSSPKGTPAVYTLSAYKGRPFSEERGALFFGGVWIRQYSEDFVNCRTERMEAYINGCQYIFTANYDYGHELSGGAAEDAGLAVSNRLFKLMQDIILQQTASGSDASLLPAD